jgi:hypothetical protein
MKRYIGRFDLFVWFEEDGRVLFEGWRSDIATRTQHGRNAVLKEVGVMPF